MTSNFTLPEREELVSIIRGELERMNLVPSAPGRITNSSEVTENKKTRACAIGYVGHDRDFNEYELLVLDDEEGRDFAALLSVINRETGLALVPPVDPCEDDEFGIFVLEIFGLDADEGYIDGRWRRAEKNEAQAFAAGESDGRYWISI